MGKQRKKGEKFKEKQLIHDKEKLEIEKHRIENFDYTLRAQYIAWILWYNTTCLHLNKNIFASIVGWVSMENIRSMVLEKLFHKQV